MTYSEAKRLLWRALGVLLLIIAATYGADYLWLRVRLAGSNHSAALGSVTLYDAVTLKSGKTEVFYDHPETVTCVYAMFPHMGYTPCWYLQRKGQEIKEISQRGQNEDSGRGAIDERRPTEAPAWQPSAGSFWGSFLRNSA